MSVTASQQISCGLASWGLRTHHFSSHQETGLMEWETGQQGDFLMGLPENLHMCSRHIWMQLPQSNGALSGPIQQEKIISFL